MYEYYYYIVGKSSDFSRPIHDHICFSLTTSSVGFSVIFVATAAPMLNSLLARDERSRIIHFHLKCVIHVNIHYYEYSNAPS